MDRFAAIDTFVRVAESQSFAEAARQLRVSRSVVTLRIQQLEEFVGAPLFHRNTRNVRLSELGQSFLRDCADLVGRTNEVVEQMRDLTGSPIGRLRVHALPGFVLGHMASVLQSFQERYPEIVLDLIVADAAIDPVKEGFDCTLQLFPPRSEEIVARRLFPVRRVLCASPHYLARYGAPRHPRDLLGHRFGWYSGYPTKEKLVFRRGKDELAMQVKPSLLTNSVHLLLDYARADAGIVCVPTVVASAALLAGTVRRVLPTWPLGALWLSVFYPTTARNALKLKLFLDSLTRAFSGTPPWDVPLIEAGLVPEEIID